MKVTKGEGPLEKPEYQGYAEKRFEESPSQLCYSGRFFEKRKIDPGGRQSYVVEY